MSARQHDRRRQSGIVLISSLLLLLVLTIMAIAMFRSIGVQGQIAGNVRDKQIALHGAETAQQYAEWWLSNNSSAPVSVACTGLGLLDGVVNANQIPVCLGPYSSPVAAPAPTNGFTDVPWTIGNANVGVTYNPPNTPMTIGQEGGVDVFYQKPRFYITDLGPYSGTGGGEVYQIDAASYGGASNTVAVVESTIRFYSSGSCTISCGQ